MNAEIHHHPVIHYQSNKFLLFPSPLCFIPMKIPFSIVLLVVFARSLWAQPQQNVSSKINEVTVFLDGAQVHRKANVTLPAGRTELVFSGLPLEIRDQAIQVEANSKLTLLSVLAQESEANKKQVPVRKELDARIAAEREQMSKDSVEIGILEYEEDLLTSNKKFIEGQGTLRPLELKAHLDMLRQNINRIRTRQFELWKGIASRSGKIKAWEEEWTKAQEPREASKKEVRILVECKVAGSYDIGLRYFLKNAGWAPSYDLRVQDVKSPMELKWKARVFQATGEEWKDVMLTLSNSDPESKADIPRLFPYTITKGFPQSTRKKGSKGYLKVQTGMVVDAQTREPIAFAAIRIFNRDGSMTGAASDALGNFRLTIPVDGFQKIEVMSVGYKTLTVSSWPADGRFSLQVQPKNLDEVVVRNSYSAEAIRAIPGLANDKKAKRAALKRKDEDKADSLSDLSLPESEENEQATNVNVEIKEPYSLSGNGKEILVEIRTEMLKADYHYVCVPKVDPEVYLTAELPDWEELNLLPGEASVYYENTFVGQTQIDTKDASDTLVLPLGVDRKISVSRQKVRSNSWKRMFESSRSDSREFQFKVRNNKALAVPITILDQFPVSDQEVVKVERKDDGGGKVDDASGIVTWKFELEPGKEKKWSLKYEVKSPRNQVLYLE